MDLDLDYYRCCQSLTRSTKKHLSFSLHKKKIFVHSQEGKLYFVKHYILQTLRFLKSMNKR